MKKLIGVNEKGLRVGQYHQRAKLTDAAVEQIRRLHEQGLSYRVIAAKFEIGVTLVCYICTYRRRVSTATNWRSV